MKKIKVFYILGILLPCIFSIFTLELIFGGWIKPDTGWSKTESLNIIKNTVIKFDTKNLYKHHNDSITYSRNLYGLRDYCKNPSDIKILTVGGSTTDQRYINDGETYQDIMQAFLLKQFGFDYCISNAGVDGHSIIGHNVSFENWFPLIPNLKPEFVLLYIGINDAKFYDEARINNFNTVKKKSWRDLSAFYKLYLSGIAFYQSRISRLSGTGHGAVIPSPEILSPGHGRNIRNYSDYSEVKQTTGADSLIISNANFFEIFLLKLLKNIDNMGAKPICVSQPHLYVKNVNGEILGIKNAFVHNGKSYNGLDYYASINEINERMKFNCIKHGGHFIDASQINFTKDDFYDAEHLTPSGTVKLGIYLSNAFMKTF